MNSYTNQPVSLFYQFCSIAEPHDLHRFRHRFDLTVQSYRLTDFNSDWLQIAYEAKNLLHGQKRKRAITEHNIIDGVTSWSHC